MALFRKFFYKKPPDGLLEISERVYVFDYCFTTDVLEEDEYKVYIGGIIGKLHDHFPDSSFMVFNFREGEKQSHIASILCDYDMTVMEYPRQYEGCPLLTMEMIHHFLRSGENWLQLGQQNVVLMHCERGGWPVLAFMLAALLIYRKQYTGEQKTLDMIYKQAPRELLQLMSPLNPLPSQLRYLQYVSRRNVGSEWPPLDRALTLDCIILRFIPNMDGEGGCRPLFRIYGQDPFMAAERIPKVLFSTPKRSKLVRHYKQADCELVKIDIHCHVQGDVVLECISLDSDLEREKMMFRVMFNTAFIRSNILILNRDEIDILWNGKDHFPKEFRVEVLFSDMDASSSIISIDLPRIEEKEGLPVEAFAKVQEIFSNVDWLDSKTEVANVLQQITASNIFLEKLNSGVSTATSSLLKESLSGRFKFDPQILPENDIKSMTSTVEEEQSITSFESSVHTSDEKIESLESNALSENNIKIPAFLGKGKQSISSSELSTDSNSTKKKIEESRASLVNDTKGFTLMAQGKKSIPLIEPSLDANTIKKKIEAQESKALLENDPKCLTSMVGGKQSILSIESSMDANSMKKKIELLESKALSENDTKSLTSTMQTEKSIPSYELSLESNLVKKEIEPLESKAMAANDIKSVTSTAQSKESMPSYELSIDANSVKKKIEPLDSKIFLENDIKSLTSITWSRESIPSYEPPIGANSGKKKIDSIELKALSENDMKSLTSITQSKESIPSYELSIGANSVKKKIEPLELKALLDNDIKSLISTTQIKESIPSLESSVYANSVKKKIEDQELQVAIQLPIQFKITSQRVRQASRSAPVLFCSSLQGSPVHISRYHSTPSALGITALLQDHAAMDTKEEVTCAVTMSPLFSTLSPSFLEVPKSVEPSSTCVPPVSSPTLLPSLSIKSSVDAPAATKNTFGPLAPASSPQPQPTLELIQPIVTQNPENTMHDTGHNSLVSPSLPPPPLLEAIKSSHSTSPSSSKSSFLTPSPPLPKTIKNSLSTPPHPTPVSFPSSSSIKSSFSTPLPLLLEVIKKSPSTLLHPAPDPLPSSSSMKSSFLAPPPPLLPSSMKSSFSTPPPPLLEATESSPLTPAHPTSVPLSPFTSMKNSLSTSSTPLPETIKSSPSTLHHPTLVPLPPSSSMKSSFSTHSPPLSETIEIPLSTSPHPTLVPLPPSYSMKSSFSTPPPPPLAPPTPSSSPGTSSNFTVKNSLKAPPSPPTPPSSNVHSSFSIPPPLPSKIPSPLSMNNSAVISSPPPPPPRDPAITSGPTLTSSVPPPPPPLSKQSATVPPVPPPPVPSANGLSKTGATSLQSHPAVGNGNVPPIPVPPSGVPFGAKGRGLLRANLKSQTQTKRSNLKPYHWLKLTRAMHGSLWAETQKPDEASKAPEFDMSELESLFSAVVPNSDHGSKGVKSNRRASGPKAEKIQLIELRRAYNCEIMLTKVKIPLPDVMSSVLALDDSALDVDQVENLIKFCPTKEEMELLKGYNGDKENLGKCEQFFLELMKVPRVESKLRVFSFKIQFRCQVSELRRDLNIVNSASEEIRNSVKLKRIMQTILSLGNALNHGTARGSAIGFRLDSLLKLTDTRARNNKMTLMHYLCKVLAEKLPELLDFPKDLVSLEASTKIQLKYLAEEMQAISKGLEKVVQELIASENDGPVSENFCKILKEFLSDAEAEVRSLAQLYSNVGRNADALALYFGEDPARCPFEQVVSTLLNFVRMFVRAHEENYKQLEFEKKKAQKEAENERLKLPTKKESEHMIRTPIKSGNIK